MTEFYHAEMTNLQPAATWLDAHPVGNGRLGAMIYGSVYEEKILLNHEMLYLGARSPELPDLSGRLGELRSLLDAGKYAEANRLYPDLLKSRGYAAETGRFCPAFDVNLISEVRGAFRDYRRTLDFECGEASVSWTDEDVRFERRHFVSRGPIDALVVEIRADRPGAVSGMISLSSHDLSDAKDHAGVVRIPANDFSGGAEGEFFVYRGKFEGEREAAAVLRVICRGGSCYALVEDGGLEHPNMTGTAVCRNCLCVAGADEVTILCDVAVGGDLDAKIERIRRKFEDPAAFEQLESEHAALHSGLFNRTRIDLGAVSRAESNETLLLDSYGGEVDSALVEKMFDYGRYLLIGSSRPGGLPANLQGVWNGDYYPAWNCTFFNNENIQMCYWQAFECNLCETVLPLFDLYDSRMEDFRENAKRLFGCRGILLPLFMDAESGRKKNLQPHVVYWTASSSWIASIYFDYYRFTGDLEFLRNRAFPFMREAALFYEDFTFLDEDGKLAFSPSVSPENFPLGDFAEAGRLSVSRNAAMDFMCLKELLENLLKTCRILGVRESAEETWKRMLAKIPPYEINSDGAVREWMHPDFRDNYRHRHLSHIYGLFPGLEIHDRTPELLEACRIAVEKRLCIGLKEQTGWSLAHMANIYARLGEGERLIECLHLLIRSCMGNNLLTYHNDWRNQGVSLRYVWADHAPFQIDANMGFSAAVAEMLVYSCEDYIKVLPALPASFGHVRAEGILCRGGAEIGLEWKSPKLTVRLSSERSSRLVLRFPFPVRTVRTDGVEVRWKRGCADCCSETPETDGGCEAELFLSGKRCEIVFERTEDVKC